MTQSDLLYRAFGELFKELEKDRATAALLGAVAKAPEPPTVVVRHNLCRVEEDWLNEIERGLVFIGKAIEEDRQFIRSDGEVQPIEKVRHISKESVQHLSRHSDLITREQKEEIVPDKLYTVERLSDYAVYENRFLYVLLLRIRDFVTARYDAIMRAYRTYRGEYEQKKNVVTGARNLTFEIRLTDEQDDVVSAPADKECADAVERMNKILQSVAFYLRTPLMTEVSRVDKLKSKITKTNVLRMDKNFREAYALYEFLLSYEKDGYTVESTVERLDPVSETVQRELALPAVLSAFLVYEHGLGLEAYLKEEFAKEEARRAEEAQKALARRVAALKKRVEETGKSMEEYMLLLEERIASLEKDREELLEARKKIEELNGTVERLRSEIKVLQADIDRLNGENARLAEEMARAEEEHRKIVEEMKRAFEEERAAAEAAHAEELSRLKERQQTELEALRAAQREELERIRTAQQEAIARAEREAKEASARVRAECEARLRENRERMAEEAQRADRAAHELSDAQKELGYANRELDVLGARLLAVRRECGLLTAGDDFTTEAGFDALEHEFEVLGRLVREQWTDVKQMLRKEFRDGIRETIHRKNARKTKEYLELSEHARTRTPAPEAERNADAENGGARSDDGEEN